MIPPYICRFTDPPDLESLVVASFEIQFHDPWFYSVAQCINA